MSPSNPTEFAPDKDAGLFAGARLPDQADVIVIGVPWEPTVSYGRGTSQAPARMVPASHQLDYFVPFLGREFADEVAMLPLNQSWLDANQRCISLADPILAEGGRLSGDLAENLAQINQISEQINGELEDLTRHWLKQGKIVAVLGGDHSSPLGSMRAHLARFPDMGVLHIDAHHDLRQAYEGFTYSHASIMYNYLTQNAPKGPLVSVGIRDYAQAEREFAEKDPRITTFYDADLAAAAFKGTSWSRQCDQIIAALPQQVYISCDIDGLEPGCCPNTGTPVPGGLSFNQTLFLIDRLRHHKKQVVGFDLCEVSPNQDRDDDEWDLNVGARLLHRLCAAAYQGK
ncbi:agmatinase family protein [Acanthopleuribacter pedis]|uniref:Agmatinase family protein n=1 Tax=Acanthopleuribacter pedis TaxID=442870 RepID=A0A8J7U520_9BACT|nr:agmatinase family protein [Acanthopleuribacter pedis]MBO1322068.1 agmatinase family protein [Acanthopleuribacter pedis]